MSGQRQGFRPPGTVFASSSTLPLAAASRPGVGHPPFSATGVFTSTAPQRHLNFRMPPLQTQTAEALATLQKLSNEYEPEIEGPLVGKRQSSQAITAEYQNADEIFVRKTAVLPQKYSHYRTVKGDGNCGWRAIAFSYFETLHRIGDKGRILEELTRLKSLNNLLNQAGFAEHLYEDFVQETLNLLSEIAYSLPTSSDDAGLLKAFNDPGISSAIITHFRLLTSAWMKTHVEAYQPFLLEDTVEQYCASQIEPYQVEIEHIGMNALIDALILPAGLAVEILYLDRSVGVEVNSHKFERMDASGAPLNPDAPTFRLLYRPGHYDILYKIEDVAALMSSPTNLQVAYATPVTYGTFQPVPVVPVSSDMSTYLEIPGMSTPFVPVTPSAMSPDTYTSPVSPALSTFSTTTLPLRPVGDIGGFRPSKYELEAEFHPSPMPNLPFQTPTFRNSHFNPAHFRNSDFQPEMWKPDTADSGRGHKDDSSRH
ncbi:hypothetical protein FGG08_007246 [Glutinoglossum americanum]|uniref:ubiquitinyl hydrolase 1 n=1 Tax=Glutinoglossum americanum TaxID=1670608 RepID=A0A9P8HZ95_9PEZI|nr:hypothetical protein FGG08_007246 [Glutinoglossum americanum]